MRDKTLKLQNIISFEIDGSDETDSDLNLDVEIEKINTLIIASGSRQIGPFGNASNGASSTEVFNIKYNGAAWNYLGSGYRNASFKYTRGAEHFLLELQLVEKLQVQYGMI